MIEEYLARIATGLAVILGMILTVITFALTFESYRWFRILIGWIIGLSLLFSVSWIIGYAILK